MAPPRGRTGPRRPQAQPTGSPSGSGGAGRPALRGSALGGASSPGSTATGGRPRFQVEIKAATGDRLGSSIRRAELRIEALKTSADDSRTRFERAQRQHDDLAAKLRPLVSPALHLREELGKLAVKLQEAAREHRDAERQLEDARQALVELQKTREQRQLS